MVEKRIGDGLKREVRRVEVGGKEVRDWGVRRRGRTYMGDGGEEDQEKGCNGGRR